MILTALGQRPVFDLFGDDYPTPDGTAIRDYIHVCDLARAHLAALACLNQGGVNQVGHEIAFNLGTGQGHSVADLIRAVEAKSGRILPVNRQPRRPGDVAALVADASRAQRLLSWHPVDSGLETLIDHAWQWFARPVDSP